MAAAATGTMAPLGVCSISRAVFASPIQLAVNLETAKGVASQPQMSYPDICFAVDNFDDPLEGMVRCSSSRVCDGLPFDDRFARLG